MLLIRVFPCVNINNNLQFANRELYRIISYHIVSKVENLFSFDKTDFTLMYKLFDFLYMIFNGITLK